MSTLMARFSVLSGVSTYQFLFSSPFFHETIKRQVDIGIHDLEDIKKNGG